MHDGTTCDRAFVKQRREANQTPTTPLRSRDGEAPRLSRGAPRTMPALATLAAAAATGLWVRDTVTDGFEGGGDGVLEEEHRSRNTNQCDNCQDQGVLCQGLTVLVRCTSLQLVPAAEHTHHRFVY